MQHAPAQGGHPENLEISLREHLLAAGASGSGPAPYPLTTTAPPQQQAPPNENPYPPTDGTSPHEHYDPTVTGHQPYGMSGDSNGEDGMSPDARKGKRELSTSKRAAQNRAAQRAFRQRKEGKIRKLEDQVKELETMEQNYRLLQNENYQLREYILNLQSRLLENHSEYPPAPSHINLHPATAVHQQTNGAAAAAAQQQSSAVEQQLQREMQQHSHSRPQEPPAKPADGISQLQAAAAQADASRAPPDTSYSSAEYAKKRPRTAEMGSLDVKPPQGI